MSLAYDVSFQDSFSLRRNELLDQGLTVLPGILSKKTIDLMRCVILGNLDLLRNTRPTRTSLHLAGFHRYPEFESLHSLITLNESVSGFLKFVLNDARVRNTGVTDITINRSQHWHKDLLRGPYENLLEQESLWSDKGTVFRVVVYLQDSDKLKIVSGSHKDPVSLRSDDHAIPVDQQRVRNVSVKAGDIVFMDVRTTHRGASEDDFKGSPDKRSIMVATTLGADNSPLTDQIEYGNSVRLRDWMIRNTYRGGA